MRTVGRGEHFRDASWFERITQGLRGRRRRAIPAPLKRIHEFFLDHLPGDHLVSTLPGGERVRVSARYRLLAWNPEEYAAFRAAIRPGDVVLDIGANLGAYTVLFGQWVGPAGRVFAFEPAPETASGLRRQVQLNGLSDRVEVIQSAMTAQPGSVRFHAEGVQGGNALASDRDAGATGVITVNATSIDAFCADRGIRPGVIKIDVEGAELDVLRGARETLRTGVQAFVEMHPSAWKASGVSVDAIAAELRAQGRTPEPLDPALDVWTVEGICVRLRRVE